MLVQKSGSFTAANTSCGVQSMNIIVGLFMDVSVPKFIELLRTTKYYGYQSDKNSNMETCGGILLMFTWKKLNIGQYIILSA